MKPLPFSPVFTLLFLIVSLFGCNKPNTEVTDPNPPRVLVLTDINNAGGDPDDKQSWIHLLWYANELDIVGFIPDRWNGRGYEATLEGLAEYQKDYERYGFEQKGYPSPSHLKDRIAPNDSVAVQMIIESAKASVDEPLYVLIWGSMRTFKKSLIHCSRDCPEA